VVIYRHGQGNNPTKYNKNRVCGYPLKPLERGKIMTKFEIGKTYTCPSACNSDCIFKIEVISRTEKSLTYKYNGKVRRSKVNPDWNGKNEMVMPDRYSMAPVFKADR